MNWLPISTFHLYNKDGSVLLWNEKMAADPEYPGHPYVVSNPEYVRNLIALGDLQGFTFWTPLVRPRA